MSDKMFLSATYTYDVATLQQLYDWHACMAIDYKTQEQVAKAYEQVYDKERERARYTKIANVLRSRIRELKDDEV